ncbi:MAG TPA: hypothetical protein PLH72_08245 [Vicinamibacterales bacterium]|nr:hypothetical protein [Vicinamibacterales bacterium]
MWRVVVVAGGYLAAAALVTWPLATGMTSRPGALEGTGGPYLNLIFLTASLAASGAAMHVLALAVTGSAAGAWLAGLAWACWPYRTAHLLHLQLQALYLMPLALWALTRVAARRRWRDTVLLGLATGLQAVASVSYGVMTAVALATAAPVLGWTTGQWCASRYWTRVAGGGALAALIVLPVAVPNWRAPAAEGPGRPLYEASNHAASLRSYAQVPPDNLVYGRTGMLTPRPPTAGERDRRDVEHQMFPGLVLVGLAGWGLWVGWRSDARPLTATAAALVATGLWLSAGPEGPLGLYRALVAHAPGFDAIRAPARFGVVALLGAALLAALGLARLVAARPRRGQALAVLLISAMVVEYVNAPLAFVEAPVTDTAVGRWLAAAPEPGAVFYLPIGLDSENTPYMVEALQHGRPIVNGYSGQRPSSYSAIVESFSTLPGADGLVMLRELGVRFVVWFGDAVIFEVRWTPESEAALSEAAVGPAPPLAWPRGITMWISADARRVPVCVDLADGFGRVRVELVDYRP